MSSPYRTPSKDLGQLEETYRSNSSARPVLLVLTIFGLPGLCLVGGVQSGEGQVFSGDRMTNIMIGVALLGLAVVTIVSIIRKATMRVDVHRNGMVWTERAIARTILWSEIIGIRGRHVSRKIAGAEASRSAVYTILRESGAPIIATHMLGDVHSLGARIESEIRKRMMPRYKTQLEARETIVFGPLKITATGVTRADREIPFSEIQKSFVAQGAIRIEPKSGRAIDIDWADVPNAKMFLELVESKSPKPPISSSENDPR